MNLVALVGNLGSDPELRVAQSGTAILKLRLATSERVKKGDDWVDHTEWHNIVSFGKRAEGLAKILSKGSKLVVTGKLRTSGYEKDGVKKYSTEIIADDIELCGSGKGKGREETTPENYDFVPNMSKDDDAEIPF